METTTMQITCACGEKLKVIDAASNSTTMCCHRCRCGMLCINHPDVQVTIPLSGFLLRRGDSAHQIPIDDLSMGQALFDSLVLDVRPHPDAVMEYGIASADHLGALQHAIAVGVTAYDLDRVMGDGPAITRLVRSVPDQPYHAVEFETIFDRLNWYIANAPLVRSLRADDEE